MSETESRPITFDDDPSDRRRDRPFACLGSIDDAAPLFAAARRVSPAGVLLAIPALLESGLLGAAHPVYGGLGPSFCGLRTTLVTLVLMALPRIERPENPKEYVPPDLGRIVGLDRAPEVKTLRRKLTRLAQCGRASALGRALATRRVAARGAVMGFLYFVSGCWKRRIRVSAVSAMSGFVGDPWSRATTVNGTDPTESASLT